MMSKRNVIWLACVATMCAQAVSRGQQPGATAGMPSGRFEVASVRPNRSGGLGIDINLPAPDRFTALNIPLRNLIRFAYNVEDERLLGGPDWIRSERFDVVAKADHDLPPWGSSGPPIAVLAMLKVLLAERFGLAVHPESRVLPVYALVVATNDRRLGPDIRPSALDCENRAKTAQLRPPPAPQSSAAQPTCGMRIAPGRMTMGGTPMSQFATVLSPFVQRVVVDRTGLAGTFDFQLSWTPERGPQGAPTASAPPPPVDGDSGSLFTALQERLGLKLEPQQVPLDVIVIERVEPPAPD